MNRQLVMSSHVEITSCQFIILKLNKKVEDINQREYLKLKGI